MALTQKQLSYSAKYSAANLIKVRTRNAKWMKENPTGHLIAKKKYLLTLKGIETTKAYRKTDKVKNDKRRWFAEHPGMANAYAMKRNAAKLCATPVWSNKILINEFYSTAKLWEAVYGGKWEVDHIIPLQGKLVCGLHVEHNLRIIPMSLNRSKSNGY